MVAEFFEFVMKPAWQRPPLLHPGRENSMCFLQKDLSKWTGAPVSDGYQAKGRDPVGSRPECRFCGQRSPPQRLHSRESTASDIRSPFCWTAAVSLGSTIACSSAVPAMVTLVPSGPTMFWVV